MVWLEDGAQHHFLPPHVKILEKVLLASSFFSRCSKEGGCTKLKAESSMKGRTATLCSVTLAL